MGGSKSKPIVESAAKAFTAKGREVSPRFTPAAAVNVSANLPLSGEEIGRREYQNKSHNPAEGETHPAIEQLQQQQEQQRIPTPDFKLNVEDDENSRYTKDNLIKGPYKDHVNKDILDEIKKWPLTVKMVYNDRSLQTMKFEDTAAYIRQQENIISESKTKNIPAGRLNYSNLMAFHDKFNENPSDEQVAIIAEKFNLEVEKARALVMWTRIPVVKKEGRDNVAR